MRYFVLEYFDIVRRFYLHLPTISHFIPNTSSSSAVITANGKASCQSSISGYMQDFNPSNLCSSVTSGSLTDRRDNQIYTVAKINGNWWMTRNLAIGCNGSGSTYGSSMSSKTLTSTYSNVSNSWSTPTLSLDKNDNTSGCTTSSTSGCNSYDTARMKCSSTYGAWYNYAAATAGTITGSSNSTNATKDVCPAGWRLPTYSIAQSVISYADRFIVLVGGTYGSGNYGSLNIGCWYSSTSKTLERRYNLFYEKSYGFLADDPGSNGGYRVNGYYIRCIRSS